MRWVPVLAGFPEALAEGAMTFPVYVFTALFYQRYGDTSFVLPFVLCYSFHRAGVFFLDCLGSVRDPYRLCVLQLSAALAGCLCLLLGPSSPLC